VQWGCFNSYLLNTSGGQFERRRLIAPLMTATSRSSGPVHQPWRKSATESSHSGVPLTSPPQAYRGLRSEPGQLSNMGNLQQLRVLTPLHDVILLRMRWRRFALLAILFALAHGVVTVAAIGIAFGRGFDLDHPEVRPSFPQRVFSALANILMQPISAFWELIGFTPRTSLLEWFAMILNSLVWGVTLALIVLLFTHRKTTITTG